MKLGVIADSHDRLPTLRQGVKLLLDRRVEALLHAGDFIAPFAAKLIAPPNVPDSVPVHAVFGNNDGERAGLLQTLPQLVDGPLRLRLDGRTIVMHHYVDWLSREDVAEADIVVSGHTHEVVTETRDGVFYLNPGECCGWVNGRCTVAVLGTDGPSAEIIELSP